MTLGAGCDWLVLFAVVGGSLALCWSERLLVGASVFIVFAWWFHWLDWFALVGSVAAGGSAVACESRVCGGLGLTVGVCCGLSLLFLFFPLFTIFGVCLMGSWGGFVVLWLAIALLQSSCVDEEPSRHARNALQLTAVSCGRHAPEQHSRVAW